MSEIVRTEAVVLRSMKYRETSKIVTFYTREFGKIAGMVKGARKPKSKFGSTLEPMSYVSLVLYKKPGRELQTVAQCDLVKPFRSLRQDLDSMSVGMAIVELVHVVAHEEEQNILLFDLIVNHLSALNAATKNQKNLFCSFEIHLLGILGFHPVFSSCVVCSQEIGSAVNGSRDVSYHLERGGPLCQACATTPGQKVSLTIQMLRTLRHFVDEPVLERLTNVATQKKLSHEIENFLWTFLRIHVSGVRTLKSKGVFASILSTL